jgi:hypothetical protein
LPIKSQYVDDETKPNDDKIIGINNKFEWDHHISDDTKRLANISLYNTNFTNNRGKLSAANIQNVRTLLTTEQLKDCAEAYTNSGFLRSVIDKNIYFMLGQRTKFMIVPNDELTEGRDDKEVRQIEKNVKNNKAYDKLRIDILRLNKRVELHDRLNKFLTNIWVFGRGFLQIERLKPDDPETTLSKGPGFGSRQYGEPIALKLLTPYRIEKTLVDDRTNNFKGILYNYGINTTPKKGTRSDGNKKVILPENLIAGWYDDNNVFDNTYYSGISPTWSVLSAAQTIEVALDKNIPEFLMAVAQGFGLIKTGTNKKSVSDDVKNTLQHSTWLIVPYKDFEMTAVNLARNPEELTGIIQSLARYICQSMNLPIFLAFEDTTNFATANQVMQSFKVSTLARHRTWLQGILEKYWYDPILADFFGVPIEEVISQEIRIKPVFEDINFETRLEILQGEDIAIRNMIHNPLDGAKAIDDKNAQERLRLEDEAVQNSQQQAIVKTADGTTKNVNTGQPAQPNTGFKSRTKDAQA